MECKISVTKCGYKRSLKAAQRQEWSCKKDGIVGYFRAIQGHSKNPPKCTCIAQRFFQDRAQDEERGDGGKVQQGGEACMEVCCWRSETH